MDIKRAKAEIENTVKAYLAKDAAGQYAIPAIRQRPILLMGPPGIGKTQIMEQIAQECGIGLVAYTITHHTRQSAVGLPFIRQRNFGGADHSVTEYTMSEIIASVYDATERTGLQEGILFIDEINCVSETLAPTMLQFLQCKTFGNQAVPAGWIIVAAGNPPAYNKSVRDFDIVTLDRVRRLDIEPSLAAWQEYARARRLHPAILAYLELRPQHFYCIESGVDGPQFVTARGWEDLSAMLETSVKLSLPIDETLMAEYLRQPEIARDFAAYWELYKKYRDDYGIEKILAGQFGEETLHRADAAAFDERISLVSLLLSGLNVRFSSAARADAITDVCYQALRNFKAALGALDLEAQTPAALFAAQCKEFEDALALRKAQGTLATDDAPIQLKAAALLRSWVPVLHPADDEDTAFDAVRGCFNRQVRYRENAVAEAGDCLEHAFDFMEQAFAEGQEMVVFVNELALGPDSSAYLAENECERFEAYSHKLLLRNLENGEDDITRELARDDVRQNEHSLDF